MAGRRQRGRLRAPRGNDGRRDREEQRGGQGARRAQLPHRPRRQRHAPRAPVRDAVGSQPPATRARHEPGGQDREMGSETPQAPRARDGIARGARIDRADRGRHDRAAGRQPCRVWRSGAAHRPDQHRTRDHARRAGGPPAPRARGHRGRPRVKRRPPRKPQRKTQRKHRPAPPVPAVEPRGDADPLADARIRPLLERYCGLAGVKQSALGPDHTKLSLPQAERPFFRDRERLSVVFSLDALERDPDAEIAVLGSPFLSQLIEAIRTRAARLSLGLIAPPAASGSKSVELTIPVRDGTVKRSTARVAVHAVGRLVARVVLRAGAGVEEAMVESDVYDLSAGAKVSDDLAGAFRDLEAGRVKPADLSEVGKAAPVPAREPGDLLRLLLTHLQEKSAERVAARRAAAEQALATELGRLDRYFESI